MTIHFICRGNVLRSLIAETYTKSLLLQNITVASSGTNVDRNDPTERQYFENTLAILARHGIQPFAKEQSHMLTQSRIQDADMVICMNQRVVDEAKQLVDLPAEVECWDIVDIGEGHRTTTENREQYEEEIYQEITERVEQLVGRL